MIFKCKLCQKHKMGKYNEIKYKALDDAGQQQEYSMEICKECTDGFQKAGISEEEFGINIGRDDTEV